MKRLYSIISAIALVLVVSGSAFAQPDVTATANIVQDLNFTRNSQLNFGQISNSQTSDAILDPQGTNTANVGNTNSLGEIEVTAASGSSIIISFTNPTDLSDGSNTIGFTPDYSGNTSSDASASTDLNTGSNNTVTADGSTGKFFIFYGGTLAGGDIDGTPTGAYTGTISTTISYE